jgi:hypothetical protein
MITSHNSIGALALGNGEVDSSILSGSTSHLIELIVVYVDEVLRARFLFFQRNHRVTTVRVLAYLDA